MKSIILVTLALVAVAVAAPPAQTAQVAQTLRSDYVQAPEGSYTFGFETDNGISRQENGELRELVDADNKPLSVVVVTGTYTYVDKDGNTETIKYVADENGYRAEGPSVPKAVRR